MKRIRFAVCLLIFTVLLIFLASVNYASAADLEKVCDGNPRCIMRSAISTNQPEHCDELTNTNLIMSCKNAVIDYNDDQKKATQKPFSGDAQKPFGTTVFVILLILLITVGSLYMYQRSKLRVLKEMMTDHGIHKPDDAYNSKLCTFISAAIKEGHKEAWIKTQLLKVGWSEDLINRAFEERANKK